MKREERWRKRKVLHSAEEILAGRDGVMSKEK